MKKIEIPFFDLKKQYSKDLPKIRKSFEKILKSGHFILGEFGRNLEQKVADLCKTKYAVGLASGSDALWLSLLALEIGPGDEVITTPYTFIATASAISKVGAKPVFLDIEEGGFSIDSQQIKKSITPKTRAIIPVHLFGLCAPMDSVLELADENQIQVIEDAAQSFGASFQNHPAGSMGEIGTLSFYPTKNLGGAGDGGMILTDHEVFAQKVKLLRAHGASKKYFHEVLGWNSRLDEIQAATLLIKLEKIKKFIEARRAIASQYLQGLKNLPLVLPNEPKDFYHTYNQFVVMTKKRDEMRDHLSKRGIGTEIYYPMPLHLQPCFANLGYAEGDFPNAERASKESLALPIYPELKCSHIQYIIKAIQDFFKSRS